LPHCSLAGCKGGWVSLRLAEPGAIQSRAPAGAGWTGARGGATIARMPLDLTDEELATAATACRAMAYQEGERAKKMENPALRAPMENTAKRYARLVEKFEAARRRGR
jgi:hypothetical protein